MAASAGQEHDVLLNEPKQNLYKLYLLDCCYMITDESKGRALTVSPEVQVSSSAKSSDLFLGHIESLTVCFSCLMMRKL